MAKLKKPKFPKLDSFVVHKFDIQYLFKQLKLSANEVLKIVIQPDTHCPDHDERAVDVFCGFLEDYKPHGLINLGDFQEMEPVSRWPAKDPTPQRLVPQIKVGRAVMDRIGKAAGPQCKLKRFIVGNHEYWLERYFCDKIPEVYDGLEELGPDLSISGLLGLKERGYKVVPFNEILAIGEAHFIHGYYTNKHHASKHLDVFGCNIYYGHLHDVQSHSGVNVRGIHESMSLGCLRTFDAGFMLKKPHNWAHAFGVFEFRADGSYTRYVPIIINGQMSYSGKLYRAS
jgi:hypothetical protein